MFDIGFWELIVIGVVALVVVGPERFPGMIKKTGHFVGQFRRIAASVKSEIQIEVDKAEQLQNLLDEQKAILKRNVEVDLTQPAVKRPTPPRDQDKKLATDDSAPAVDVKSSVKPSVNTDADTKADVSAKHDMQTQDKSS